MNKGENTMSGTLARDTCSITKLLVPCYQPSSSLDFLRIGIIDEAKFPEVDAIVTALDNQINELCKENLILSHLGNGNHSAIG